MVCVSRGDIGYIGANKDQEPLSAGNKYPLSEPEHESYTKNSLLNDICSNHEGKKALESKCDYICDIFFDNNLNDIKKCAYK